MAANPDQNNVLRQQDLEKMMDQIENLARSGAKDQARQLLSEMQRMMNNLQAGRMQQQQGEDNSEMREQMDKLGQLMQRQQKLMDETFKFDQALRDRMQRGDPLDGEDQELFNQDMPQEPGQQPDENAEPGPLDEYDGRGAEAGAEEPAGAAGSARQTAWRTAKGSRRHGHQARQGFRRGRPRDEGRRQRSSARARANRPSAARAARCRRCARAPRT